VQQAGSAIGKDARVRIDSFEYPACAGAPGLPGWEGWPDAGAADGSAQGTGDPRPGTSGGPVEARLRAEFAQRLAVETRQSFEAGRERGRQEGCENEREAQVSSQAAAEQRRMRQAAELIESFAQERDRYLQAVEQEVVKLALAVAARILRREAQMDPLLLSGAVRVALGQLAGSTQVRLRVPVADKDLWAEAMALVPNLAVKPTILGEDGMRLGDCALETELGSVDLGIRSQLGEIERGFFDRAGDRLASPPTWTREAPKPGAETHP
jgi:flagellar assembly protein FliH